MVKRVYKKKSYKKRGYIKPTYKNIVRIVKEVEGELKHYQFPLLANYGSISTTTTTWIENLLTYIPQGVGDGQRIGTKINLMGWKLEGNLVSGYTGTVGSDQFNNVRLVIGEYEMGNTSGGYGPLYGAGLAGATGDLRKDTCNTLIRKYTDKMIPLYPNGSLGSYALPVNRFIKIHKWFKKPYTISYTSSLATTGNSGLWLSAWSDSSSTPSPGFVTGYCTVYYRDT